jgi:microcystin-dependent protein
MDVFLSQIQVFPLTWPPVNWHICDGSLLAIRDYTALYSLLGNTFGGDGSTTFGLPDYRKISPTGSLYFICVNGQYPERQ